MANYYNDNPNLQFYLDHPLMKRIVELKERNFADKDNYDYAPVDYEDAMENYRRVLDITGDITANIIEPNSESVDLGTSMPAPKAASGAFPCRAVTAA